jgi:hypothetical protein
MSRKTTDIDTHQASTRHANLRLSSRTAGCSTHSGGSRTRRTVTAVLVVLGILAALGLAFWGAAAVRGISL